MNWRNLKLANTYRIIKFFLAICLILAFCTENASLLALPESDKELLLRIQKDSCNFFLRYSDFRTGLTRDSSRAGSPASVAATGFSLAALAIAYSHGWLSKEEAYDKILKTLDTLKNKAEHKNGFFYHFINPVTGKRVWASEASSIDTALVVAGALLCGEYFKGTEIEKLAHEIYERVDWEWMLNGSFLICHGWKPKTGFLPYYWDSYSELIILEALAIGSPTHPVPKEVWNEWYRFEDTYNEKRIIYCDSGSLFTYQYSQAYIDFKELSDENINYFTNSANATVANREFCLENSEAYKTYDENCWGLTASLGPGGYKAYGAKPGKAKHDGTVAPCGSIGSLVFTPTESMGVIRYMYDNYKDNLYGKFGFKDSFNIDKDWWANEYLGIDQGISVLMIENYLSGKVWENFMKLDCIKKWIELCNLKTG